MTTTLLNLFLLSKLRSVGVKSADELYKSINMSVRESVDLRVYHEAATRELKESCGLQPVSNIKQVYSKLLKNSNTPSLSFGRFFTWNKKDRLVVLRHFSI